ncbi:MAG: CBS domain-containing protein [Chloroflexi bacterium]|nr:CBS domain-containing protein [Chloroflexota bacterium]
MKVQQYMKTNAISIGVEDTVQEAAGLFVQHHIGTLPVVDGSNHLVGILHIRDLLQLVMPAFVDLIPDFDFVRANFGVYEEAAISAETADTPIRNLMGTAVSVRESSGLLRAFAILDKHEMYDLPVVDDDGRLVGLASRVDIGTAFLAQWQQSNP